MAATPRPWQAKPFGRQWVIVGPDDYTITLGGEAHVRLIVRSVNHHDELVAACRGMADRLGEYVDELLADKRAGEAANIMRIVSTLRSVAAKAEEQRT